VRLSLIPLTDLGKSAKLELELTIISPSNDQPPFAADGSAGYSPMTITTR
jgi:hypothetical protein